MKRRFFLGIAGSTILVTSGGYYLSSDKYNLNRNDMKTDTAKFPFMPDEREILYLAALAPSGHNTQPWFIKYNEPYHWTIGNDKRKWLPAVDPNQRETILSIGTFLQNLEYTANHLGYACHFKLLATNNQDENIMDVKLVKSAQVFKYDITKIRNRRTVRSNYLSEIFKKEDLHFLMQDESDSFHFIPNTTKEYQYLNEQTIEANRMQSYRDDAQEELSEWIRFSSKDAEKNSDGLTTASMEIKGIPGWILRNFYGKANVMQKSFRDEAIDKTKKQVSQSAGWMLITSKDNSVNSLLETGKRMQRLFLKVREKNIALHPMTQILEEPSTHTTLNQTIGIDDPVQFILRMGYLKDYPEPVSLRRSIEHFIRV